MYLLSGLHGHATSSWPAAERGADRVNAADPLAVLAERVQGSLTHVGHDAHRDGDVGRVGQLHADVGRSARRSGPSRRARRTSSGPAWHPGRARACPPASRTGSRQLFVGPGVALRFRADERAVLDAGDVARIGVSPVRARPLLLRQAGERAGTNQLGREAVSSPPASRRTTRPGRGGGSPSIPQPRRQGARARFERSS